MRHFFSFFLDLYYISICFPSLVETAVGTLGTAISKSQLDLAGKWLSGAVMDTSATGGSNGGWSDKLMTLLISHYLTLHFTIPYYTSLYYLTPHDTTEYHSIQ